MLALPIPLEFIEIGWSLFQCLDDVIDFLTNGRSVLGGLGEEAFGVAWAERNERRRMDCCLAEAPMQSMIWAGEAGQEQGQEESLFLVDEF
ncbi:hypothetical protein AVEN_35021-1 [Araneus ventricosus]|uniref:Uncharacterized protein n=1 Tax=Araneus ventricosus TaxID=182803 RepID=A0A4Y2I0J5_ARAVE|nr:hypothetical protein AVEN_35021-1 [Araneus ventricosus]